MEKYKLTEKLEVDVIGYVRHGGEVFPLVDIPWMSAEKEHQIAEEQRRKHPEIYAEIAAGECPPDPDIPVVYIRRK